jgi:hypothetical protein
LLFVRRSSLKVGSIHRYDGVLSARFDIPSYILLDSTSTYLTSVRTLVFFRNTLGYLDNVTPAEGEANDYGD